MLKAYTDVGHRFEDGSKLWVFNDITSCVKVMYCGIVVRRAENREK
jgi:hypothetical protein